MSKKEYANAYQSKKYIIPKGHISKRPGQHKRSHNRIATEDLLGIWPTKIKESIIKYADKFDEKQIKKSEAKRSNKKEKERQKDILTK